MNDSPSIGHNSGQSADRLRAFARQIERLEDEKRGLASDIKDVYGEARSAGYDAKILRKAIKEATRDSAEREEEASLMAIYLDVIIEAQPAGEKDND